MAMTFDHRSERANAIALPPAPANISMTTVLDEGVLAARSLATLLFIVRAEERAAKRNFT